MLAVVPFVGSWYLWACVFCLVQYVQYADKIIVLQIIS